MSSWANGSSKLYSFGNSTSSLSLKEEIESLEQTMNDINLGMGLLTSQLSSNIPNIGIQQSIPMQVNLSQKMPNVGIKCRYGKKCTRPDCAYLHPKGYVNICRFGDSCTRKDCYFRHPGKEIKKLVNTPSYNKKGGKYLKQKNSKKGNTSKGSKNCKCGMDCPAKKGCNY